MINAIKNKKQNSTYEYVYINVLWWKWKEMFVSALAGSSWSLGGFCLSVDIKLSLKGTRNSLKVFLIQLWGNDGGFCSSMSLKMQKHLSYITTNNSIYIQI